MGRNTTNFIALLSSHIHKDTFTMPEKMDWEQLYLMGKIHAVSGMLYLSLQPKQRLSLPDTIQQKLKQDFVSTVSRAANQDIIMQQVLETFNCENLDHLLFKGYVLKDLYPAPEMRTMGDIDILIHATDRYKSNALLKGLGFEAAHTYGNVWTYVKGVVRLEVHDHVMSRNFNYRADYREYYNEAWNYAIRRSPNEASTYHFAPEHHFIYAVAHMAKHFYSTGCGIRMFMDIAVFLRRYSDELDWTTIQEELTTLKLDVFAGHVVGLCAKWFGTVVPVDLPELEEDFYGQVTDYVFSAGIFGYYQRNSSTSLLRNMRAARHREDNLKTRGRWLFSTYRDICFPSYEIMTATSNYAFLKNRPVLLPAAWGIRAARSLLLRGRRTLALLAGIKTGEKEYDRQGLLLQKIGL